MIAYVLFTVSGFVVGGYVFYHIGREQMREEADREFNACCRACMKGGK